MDDTGLTPLPAELLARYLANEASSGEREVVAAWTAADSRAAALIEALGQGQPCRAATLDVDRGWRGVASRLRESQDGRLLDRPPLYKNGSLGSQTVPRRGLFGKQSLRIGIASTMLLVVATLGTWFVRSNQTDLSSDAHVYQTAPGQRSTVRLADGSTMMLAPATTVSMTAQGAVVTGEAYFSIVPHSTRPFGVQTNNSVVQVLGTRFSVRQYPGEARSQIVVEDGKISVRRPTVSSSVFPPVVLSARMLAQVSDSGVTVSSGITTRDFTSWTRGTLVFRGVTLRDAVAELARAYNVEIQVADSVLAEQTMRMDVSVVDDAIYKVLDVICRVSDAHYTRNGRTFVLSPGRAKNQVPQTVPQAIPQRQRFPQPEKQYGR